MLRLQARHRSAACAIVLVLPLRLAAAQEGRPPAPDSVAPRGRLSSAMAIPPAATGLGPAGPISDGQFVVLMAAGPTALALDTVRTRAAVEAGCPEHALASELPAGADADSVALGGQTLAVIVVGAHRATNSCQVAWNLSPFTIWRAAALPGAQGSIARAPLAARLIVDGAAVPPLLEQAATTTARTAVPTSSRDLIIPVLLLLRATSWSRRVDELVPRFGGRSIRLFLAPPARDVRGHQASPPIARVTRCACSR